MSHFSLRLDAEIRSRLEAEARRRDRSASWIATKAIESYLSACDEKRHAIENALADADEGVFISGEAMNSWVEKWVLIKRMISRSQIFRSVITNR